MNWPALPFVRLLLPFGVGVVAGTLSIPVLYPLLIFGIQLVAIFLLFARSRIQYRSRRIFGFALFALLLNLGFLLRHFHTPWNQPLHLRHLPLDEVLYQFQIRQIKATETGLRLEGEVRFMAADTIKPRAVSGGLLLYLPADSLSRALIPGDQLLVKAPVQLNPPPQNPMAFDFAGYMAKKGIYHRSFAKTGEWSRIGHTASLWQRTLQRCRQYCLEVLSGHMPGQDEFSVAAALIMGQRNWLSEEVRAAYTDTGAIHVLAVSGLHVGIVFLALNSLFNLLGWSARIWPWLRCLSLLAAIWGFAIFTGGSASVLRAACMFSFVVLGQTLHRSQNIYNTLAASAFLLLCVQPQLISDIGFQLSYLAVIGIVFFQGRIYRSWYPGSPIPAYLWKLACVSLAAQITTLPISLYYFHQFPLYFCLSGWVVVPAAALILSLGLALFLLSKIGLVATLLGKVLYHLIWAMNGLILAIQELPGGLLTGIWISGGMVGLLYLVIMCAMSGLSRKRLAHLQWGLVGMIVVSGGHNWNVLTARHQEFLAVYHLYGHSAIDYFNGATAFCVSDLPAEDPKLQMATGNFRDARHIRQLFQQDLQEAGFQHPAFFRSGNFLQLGAVRMAVIDQLPPEAPAAPVALDFLLLRSNAKLKIADLKAHFAVGTLIFDASNSRRRAEQWRRECRPLQQSYHDIGQDGAFVIDLRSR